MYSSIEVCISDGMQIIRLNRPECKNAMSTLMWQELICALDEGSADESVAFTVLTGNGSYYSSGNDMKDNGLVQGLSMDQVLQEKTRIGRNLVSTLIDYPKVLIAVVNGPAIGLAVTTLALCDVVYASANATFCTPFSSMGLCAEGCSSYLFPRIMGQSKAGEMLYLGKILSANEASNCGLVARVFEEKDLQDVLWPMLAKMTHQSKQSLSKNKKLMRKWDKELLHKVNEAEWDELMGCFTSEDFANAVFKFLSRGKG